MVFLILLAVEVTPVFAQKIVKKFGNDSISCITHTSLYREFYKQQNFADALPHWRWVFNNCPLVSQNLYIDGVKMISMKINAAKDLDTRNAYIDTVLMIYDQRIKYFGDTPTSREGMVLGREAIELEIYRPSDTLRIYDYLRRSVEKEGLDSEPLVVSRYFINVINMVANNRFPSDSIAEVYDRLSNLVDRKLELAKNDADQVNKWKEVKELLESQFEPFATCDEKQKSFIGISYTFSC